MGGFGAGGDLRGRDRFVVHLGWFDTPAPSPAGGPRQINDRQPDISRKPRVALSGRVNLIERSEITAKAKRSQARASTAHLSTPFILGACRFGLTATVLEHHVLSTLH